MLDAVHRHAITFCSRYPLKTPNESAAFVWSADIITATCHAQGRWRTDAQLVLMNELNAYLDSSKLSGNCALQQYVKCAGPKVRRLRTFALFLGCGLGLALHIAAPRLSSAKASEPNLRLSVLCYDGIMLVDAPTLF